MREFVQVLLALLQLYLAIGLMCIGFAYMFSGKSGGTRAAHFYFGRSLRWTFRHVRAALRRVLTALWVTLIHRILRPLGRALLRGLRALFRWRPRMPPARRW